MTTRTLIKPYRGPDWRDASQYPEFGSTDYERLTWEFIRRSDGYAKLMTVFSRLADGEYQDGIKEESDTVLDGLECVPKANPGETAREYFERMKKREKRGRILTPIRQLKSRWYMEPTEILLPDVEFDTYTMNFVPHVVAMRVPKGESMAVFSLPLYPDEIAFRFRLDVSFEKQWRDARSRFNSARAEANVKAKAKAKGKAQIGKNTKEPNLDFAHFWLRAFDAHHALVKASTKKNKETGTWQEVVRAHLEQELEPSLKQRIKLRDYSAEEWRSTASSYIDGRKFAALLYRRKKTAASANGGVQRMVKLSQATAAQKRRIATR